MSVRYLAGIWENCALCFCSAEAGMSVSIHDVVFRDFKDFEPHAGTPIDIMHNMESGMMADLLEV
jgi:hypothetical protein